MNHTRFFFTIFRISEIHACLIVEGKDFKENDSPNTEREERVDLRIKIYIFLCLFFIYIFLPFFSPISWYPIGSYGLVSSLQLPYELGRGES